MTLAAITAGLHVSNQKLSDMRMVVFGAGTAGCGIADQVVDAIAAARNIGKEEAAKQIWYSLLYPGTPISRVQMEFICLQPLQAA